MVTEKNNTDKKILNIIIFYNKNNKNICIKLIIMLSVNNNKLKILARIFS